MKGNESRPALRPRTECTGIPKLRPSLRTPKLFHPYPNKVERLLSLDKGTSLLITKGMGRKLSLETDTPPAPY